MERRLIVFDVDGTLVDSQAAIVAAMAAGFAAVRRPLPPRAEILAIVGLSLPVALARLMPGADRAALETAVAAYRAGFVQAMAAGATASPLFPGMRALLDALAAEPATLLGIATGKSRRGLAALLEAQGLTGLFHTAQTADDHPSKPDPAMLLACLAATGVAPERATMIGDTGFDIAMARAAGIAAIGVGWGYHSAESLRAAGAPVARDAAGLARLLAARPGLAA
jgi:phosphoglycolate phosphatase